MIKSLTTSEFKDATYTDTSLIAFTAPWCPPCRELKPILEEFAEDNSNIANFYSVNIDDEKALAKENRIMGIPTILVFKNGVQTARESGSITREKLTDMIM